MVFSNNLLMGAAGQSTGYTIDQSVRINDNDTAYLYRTPASSGNRKTWTFSIWIKRGNIGTAQVLFGCFSTYQSYLRINADNKMQLYNERGSTSNWTTTQVFRDPGAWMHIVWQYDVTQATANDRQRLWINGGEVTDFTRTSTAAQNTDGTINIAAEHRLFRQGGSTNYYDGYAAEINFVDGTALDATSFGEYNDDGVWVPIKYTGSYGTNGFYITGADSADLGADDSGNGNDFTSSGLAAADQVSDSPTDNFCVLSPIDKNSNFTLSDGNLTNSNGTNADAACFSTIAFDASDTDGWYWEVNCDSFSTTGFAVLIADEAVNQTDITTDPTTQPAEGNLWAYARYKDASNGGITGVGSTGSFTNYGSPAVNGDVIGFCVKNGKLFIAINNTWLESSDPDTETSPAFSNLTGNLRVGVNRFRDLGTDVTTLNFGQTGFTYTPPTGAKAISTANLPDPTIADPSAYFQTTLYTGNGTAIGSGGNAVDQSGNSTFQPDFVWIKNRDAADNHMLYDAVRGATKDLHSNTTDAEATDTEGLSTFDTDGFTVGSNVAVNTNTENYVAWQWAADGTSGSSNTDGSITSTVSADTTSGFSIATYTGNATVGATVGHGLGVAPKVVIVKNRSGATTENWVFGHDSMGWTKAMYLNSTAAPFTLDIYWNNTAPTSSVVELHDHPVTNGSSYTYVMYSFAEVEGFSKFGSYTGNGATDGTFVYTGFRPNLIILKQSNAVNDWLIYDSERDPINVAGRTLRADVANAEFDGRAGTRNVDFVSNGFKFRSSNSTMNASGGTFIYMAFAESPFKTALAQ